MIKEINVENVRVFDGKLWQFKMAPLTVLCGSNSTGKSSLLRALLLLAQSARVGVEAPDGRLRFSGRLIDLGNYRSFVSHRETSRDITIELVMSGRISTKLLSTIRSSHSEAKSLSIPEGSTAPYEVAALFRFGLVEADRQMSLPVEQHESKTPLRVPKTDRALLKEAHFSMRCDGRPFLEWDITLRADKDETEYELILPFDFFDAVGGSKLDVPRSQFVRMEALMQGFLPISVYVRLKAEGKKAPVPGKSTGEWSFWPLPPGMSEAVDELRTALTHTYYLGPLRSPAKRFYVVNVESAPEIDPRGEFLPYLVREKADTSVRHFRPHETTIANEPLRRALNSWIFYLRSGEAAPEELLDAELSVSSAHDVILECSLRSFNPKESYALADSGFGYSQVIPILVRGLLTPPGSIMIVEQPELHLNPGLQVRLAEFFVSMISAGKQIIIETHSEHVVNAIRALAVEDESGDLADKTAIFFFANESGQPKITPLNLQHDGTVPEWPREFFGEALSLSTRLLKAQQRFRKRIASST